MIKYCHITQNPGYYDISAQDVSVWHVPNNEQLKKGTSSAILRYHTESQFLKENGGNLYHLFKVKHTILLQAHHNIPAPQLGCNYFSVKNSNSKKRDYFHF